MGTRGGLREQERNVYAVQVLKRVKAKLEGRDYQLSDGQQHFPPEASSKLTIQQQVPSNEGRTTLNIT